MMQPRRATRTAMAAALAVLMTAGGAQAQEWHNSLTLYGIIPWVDTEVTGSGGNSVDSLATPSDMIDALDFT